MSRCICCNAMLPANTVFRTILIPHPTETGKTTTMRVEDDFCNKCSVKANVYYTPDESESDVIRDLGLNIPEVTNYDQY